MITPRTDNIKNQNSNIKNEVVQTATFGKGEEFSSFSKPHSFYSTDNEGSPNVVSKMRSIHSIDQNKQNEMFVSFFNDINQPKTNININIQQNNQQNNNECN